MALQVRRRFMNYWFFGGGGVFKSEHVAWLSKEATSTTTKSAKKKRGKKAEERLKIWTYTVCTLEFFCPGTRHLSDVMDIRFTQVEAADWQSSETRGWVEMRSCSGMISPERPQHFVGTVSISEKKAAFYFTFRWKNSNASPLRNIVPQVSSIFKAKMSKHVLVAAS